MSFGWFMAWVILRTVLAHAMKMFANTSSCCLLRTDLVTTLHLADDTYASGDLHARWVTDYIAVNRYGESALKGDYHGLIPGGFGTWRLAAFVFDHNNIQ